jgi:hypothetical protein
MYLNEADTGGVGADQVLQLDMVDGAVVSGTTNSIETYGGVQSFTWVGLQKIDGNWAGIAGNDSGFYLYTSFVTPAGFTPDRVLLLVRNNASAAPGSIVMGFDFFRMRTGKWLP